MKKFISLVLSALLVVSVLSMYGCQSKEAEDTTVAANAQSGDNSNAENPVATITMNDGKTITVELYYDKAPNTVKNFISLANKGFYDGLTFHRVINNFMIQGGDPNGDGTGNPGYSIKGEFSANGVQNTISHVRGVISMGRTMASYDSAGCQFFICQADRTSLDGQYAAFGMVTDGLDVVDEIASVETNSNDKPVTDVIIKTIKVDTKGVTYDEPETIVN